MTPPSRSNSVSKKVGEYLKKILPKAQTTVGQVSGKNIGNDAQKTEEVTE